MTAQEHALSSETTEAHFFLHELTFVLAGTSAAPASSGESNGGASHGEERSNNLTFGAEYELRFHRVLGVGATIEYITHEKNWLFVFPAYFHVYRGLKLQAGPGLERKHEHAQTEAVVRVGAMYSFEFARRYSITPTVALDLIGRENAIVYGVNIGVGF